MPEELTNSDPQVTDPLGSPDEHRPEAAPAPAEVLPPPAPEAEAPPEPPAETAPPAPRAVPPPAPVEEPKETEEPEEEEPAPAPVETAPVAVPSNKKWYVVKVQSGREESIKEAIERRVRIEGLEEFFGQIVIPVERVTEMRNNKRVERTRKLYPGYLMCEVEYNDRILYLFRETSGVGDFVGGSVNRAPPPMPPKEVEAMLGQQNQQSARVKDVKPKFDRGDRVRVKDGMFAGMEGEVKELMEAKNQVKVELTIFGRPVPVELDYWQVEVL
jgi:transcription termination/antitermination protein NusG